MKNRFSTIFFIGLIIGVLLPFLVLPFSMSVLAQALPFTPTPEPTDTAVPTGIPTRTVTPTNTATSTVMVLPDAPPIGTEHATQQPQATGQVVVIVATPTEAPKPTKTPLPAGYGRDHCDPNHTLSQPCALATETDNPDLNFNSGPVDVFSFLLKAGRQYRIEASSSMGLDPVIEVFLAGAIENPIAVNDDERIGSTTAALTISVELDSWYLVRVSNNAPDNPEGKTYTISARSVATTSNTEVSPEPSNPDDLIGNAYDEHHAARLAWGVPYDLSMQCPVADACWAGRHTFAFIPIKRDVPITVVTYDLGAGVDTVLTLYKPDPTQQDAGDGKIVGWRAVASNDDVVAGWTLRSQIVLTPDWNSVALLVIAPSDRSELPILPADGRPGRYRLIIGSPALPAVKSVIEAQQDVPPPPATPTPRPTSQADIPAVSTVEAQDSREVIKESCPTGVAVVGEETGFYAAAPPADGDRLASYPQGAAVKLLGECYRGWVKVQPFDSVTPGWMWGPTLRPEALDEDRNITTSVTPPSTPMVNMQGTPIVQETPQPTLIQRTIVLETLSPAPLPTPVTAPPVARSLTVTVCRAAGKQTQCSSAVSGVRVDLLLASHEVQVSGVTDEQGKVTLSTSLPAGSGLFLRVPALGLLTSVAQQSEIAIRIPEGSK